MLLAHNTSLFWGEGHITKNVSKAGLMWGKTPFPSSFERFPLGSWEEGSLDVDT